MNTQKTETILSGGRRLPSEELENIGYLAAVGWPDGEMAVYLGLSLGEFNKEMSSEGSPLRKAVVRGRLQKRAEIEIAAAKGAASGDPKSVSQYADIVRDKSFSLSKLDLFGGPEDSGAFERIQEYIAEGSAGDLSADEQIYIDILVMIYSLDGKFGKRRTIKFLTSPPFSFSYRRAADMYSESVEMFFCNRKVSKEALRQKMADQFDSLYIAARNSAQCPRDYEIASGILANKARVLQLDKDDPEKLPAEAYLKQYRVLSLTPQVLGLPPADRLELARQIDSMEVPDRVKRRVKMESGVEDMDIIEMLENGAQEEG